MAALWPWRDGPGIRYISGPPSPRWRRLKKRALVILGSTGSIGRSALDVVRRHPAFFRVLGLSCARGTARLAEQALAFRPDWLAVLDEEAACDLKARLPRDYRPEILTGPEGYRTLASLKTADTVLSAQSGSAGLSGTLAACLAGKTVCLANKESLVLAGDLVRHVCARTGASILPVDSEHYAVFDCLAGRGDEPETLILTASGGPFRDRPDLDLDTVTPAQALKHPNWNMGAKITIDSATLMNKALEVIEACQLYGLPPDRVQVLIHPQSIVHSLVVFRDASLLAQLAVPDMRLPIGSCLLWPRVTDRLCAPLSLATAGSLSFSEADPVRFPALELARLALRTRRGMSIVLSAADETAVQLFLAGRCTFADITRLVRAAMEDRAARIGAEKEPGGPFSLGDVPREDGGLAAACRRQAEAIEDLAARTADFVRRFAENGGTPTCS